mgnify:CR=1 FL=1
MTKITVHFKIGDIKMKLNELLQKTRKITEAKKPSTTCEYLDSIGIKYKKVRNANGATFDLIDSTPKETSNLYDDIKMVSEITDHYDIGYAGGTIITVEIK